MTRIGEPQSRRDGGELVRSRRLGTKRTWTNATWLFAGNAVYAVGQWLTLVGIARLGGPDMAGEYGLGLAISAPVVLLASLALRTVQATDARFRFGFADYLRLRLATMAAAFTAIAVIAVFLRDGLTSVVILVGLAKCCDGVGDIFHGAFQRGERMAPIGISLSANGLLTFGFVTLLLAWRGALVTALWGSVAASVLASIVYCTLAIRRSQRRPGTRAPLLSRQRSATMLALGRFALPLGLASGLTSVNANIPRYALEARLGSSALGVFTAIAVMVLALNTLVGAVAQSLLPSFSRAYATGGRPALRSPLLLAVVASLAGGLVVTTAGLFLGESALARIYGAEYAGQLPAFVWMLAYAGIASAIWFADAALSACGLFRSQLGTGIVGFAVVGLTAWPLVGAFGTAGSSLALVFSGTAQLAMKLWRFMHASQAGPRRA